MRFVRSRLGLIVWASLWLLVAVVPSLRREASRVLLASLPFAHTQNYERGLPPEMEREAARRFPDEVAAQLAPLTGFAAQPPDANLVELRRQEDQYFGRYDALEKQFPFANVVRIQRLRDTMRGSMGIDEGLLASRSVPNKREPNPVWLSKQQLERALQSAQEGARLEPDNAFFPWMKCVLNFSLKRDAQAIVALEEAGHCSRFEDDVMGVAQRRIDLMRRLKNPSFEDEVGELASVLIPHLSPMRSAARAVTGQMRLARQHGDEARALELVGLLQRAGAPITRTNGALITKLVGEAICVIAWRASVENEPNLPQAPWGVIDGPVPQEYFDETEKVNKEVARRFASFARAHKRSDLAREAEALAASFDGERLSAKVQSLSIDSIWKRGAIFERFRWAEDLALSLNLLAVVLWVTSLILTLGKPVLAPEQKRRAQLSALWSAGAGSVLAGVVAARSPDVLANWGFTPSTPSTQALQFIFDNFLLIFVGVGVLPIVGAMLWNWFKGFGWEISLKTMDGRKRALIFGVVGLFVLLLFGAVLDTTQPGFSQTKLIPPLLQTLLTICVLVGSGLWAWWGRGPYKAGMICFTVALWLGCTTELLAGSRTYYSFYAVVIGVIAVFCASMGAILSWQGWLPSWRGTWTLIRDLSARIGIAAGTLALLCTLGYVGLVLWTIPAERSAKELLNQHLQVGEVAMLRQQISQN